MHPQRAAYLKQFAGSRLGLFVHYGLYSILGRGEWVLNREQIPVEEYKALQHQFNPSNFDADALVRLAKEAGCRYLCFTTMHHDGFALYDTKLTDFNSVKVCGRDLVAEVVAACRKHGLKIHLYHTLNNWTSKPDAVDALETKANYDIFMQSVFARFRELVTKFNPVDCIWYDGAWPFSGIGWQGEALNKLVHDIQPHVIVNGRNGLPGDFATPEQHIAAPSSYRPWEACITHNSSWCYHVGDVRFKPTWMMIDMLTQIATGAGNLLLNIGPDATGAIPQPSVQMLRELGQWTSRHAEAIYDTEPLTMDWNHRGEHRGEWSSNGRYTIKGNTLYHHLLKWPGTQVTIAGIENGPAKSAKLLGSDAPLKISQQHGRLQISGLPAQPPLPQGGVVKIEFDTPPVMYLCGGLRTPRVPHPHYDPGPSDLPPL